MPIVATKFFSAFILHKVGRSVRMRLRKKNSNRGERDSGGKDQSITLTQKHSVNGPEGAKI